MKLLFSIFASLMLQYQVNSEFVNLKKCFFGFGKCRDNCLADEKEIQECKHKKCCIGPKVIQLIKSYLRHEIPHIPDEEVIEMLKTENNSSVEMQRKHLSKASPFSNINRGIASNISPMKLITMSTRSPSHSTHTSTKRIIKKH